MSVVDKNLAWGTCDLTPDLVSREVTPKPWETEATVIYGAERLSVEGDDESIYDVAGDPLTTRAMIVRVLLLNQSQEVPWKTRVRAKSGPGWLVVSEGGWKFFPDLKA